MLSCCLSQMFCSLRSQIFFTVRMANKQESKTKMMQLYRESIHLISLSCLWEYFPISIYYWIIWGDMCYLISTTKWCSYQRSVQSHI